MDVTPHMRGPYLKADNVNTGDVVTIIGETKQKKGYSGNAALAVDIKWPDGIEQEANLNQKSVKSLADAWGVESTDWINRQIIITVEEVEIFDKEEQKNKVVKVVNFEPNEDEDQSEAEPSPDIKKEDIPVID